MPTTTQVMQVIQVVVGTRPRIKYPIGEDGERYVGAAASLLVPVAGMQIHGAGTSGVVVVACRAIEPAASNVRCTRAGSLK